MKHLNQHWSKIERNFLGKTVLLFLDYDGTLAPIAPSPDLAVTPAEIRDVLRALAKEPFCRVAIVSGRALNDVRGKVGVANIDYIGNHGLEIEGHDIHFQSMVSPKVREALGLIRKRLHEELSHMQGVFIEDKGLTLSVHYRKVALVQLKRLRSTFKKISAPYQKKGMIKVSAGKKVLELRPPVAWDKGKAVVWLLSRWKLELGGEKTLPVYVGDDVTDEDAFTLMKGKGLTVHVGDSRRTAAEYFLKDPAEVSAFLGSILRIKKGEHA